MTKDTNKSDYPNKIERLALAAVKSLILVVIFVSIVFGVTFLIESQINKIFPLTQSSYTLLPDSLTLDQKQPNLDNK